MFILKHYIETLPFNYSSVSFGFLESLFFPKSKKSTHWESAYDNIANNISVWEGILIEVINLSIISIVIKVNNISSKVSRILYIG